MEKALVITSFRRNFHNYRDGVDKELHDILKGKLEIETEREGTERLTLEELQKYACVICYCPALWELTGKEPFAAALASYVFMGGRLLLLHIMSFGGFAEGAQLFGGAFRMHPPYQEYRFVPAGTEDPVLEGVEDFSLCEEAHLLHTDRLLPKEMLLFAVCDRQMPLYRGVLPHQDIYAQNSGIRVPLAWKYRLCRGKVLYSCPGHNAESFREPSYRRFLQNAVCWLLEQED